MLGNGYRLDELVALIKVMDSLDMKLGNSAKEAKIKGTSEWKIARLRAYTFKRLDKLKGT